MYRLGEGGLLAEHVDGRRVLQLDQLARNEYQERPQVPEHHAEHDEVEHRAGVLRLLSRTADIVEVAFEAVELLESEVGHRAADEGLEQVRYEVDRSADLDAEENAPVRRAEGAHHSAGDRRVEQLSAGEVALA